MDINEIPHLATLLKIKHLHVKIFTSTVATVVHVRSPELSVHTCVGPLRTGTSLRSLRIDIELVNSHCDIVYQLPDVWQNRLG